MKIALDVDGTIADVNTIINKKFNHPFSLDQITKWECWELYGISKEQWFKEYIETWSLYYEEIPLHEQDLKYTLQKLVDKGYQIDIVTSRPIEAHINLRKWLDMHDLPYNNIIRVSSQADKLDLYHEIHIDDFYTYLKPNKYQYILDRAWNRNLKEYYRIPNIKSLLPILLSKVYI